MLFRSRNVNNSLLGTDPAELRVGKKVAPRSSHIAEEIRSLLANEALESKGEHSEGGRGRAKLTSATFVTAPHTMSFPRPIVKVMP